MTDAQLRRLDTDAVAGHLEAPVAGTAQAILILGPALSASLTAYNTAHAPTSHRAALVRSVPDVFARPSGGQMPAPSRTLGG
ncbi:MAG: hypothetical protein ACTHJI_19195 [Leifsonia sp.]